MAFDPIILNLGTGGDSTQADKIGSVKYQVIKIAVGAEGSATLIGNSNPIPVSDAGGSLTVDGSVTVVDGGGSITVDGTVAVSGTVTVDGSGVTQPVSGTVAVSSISTSVTPGTAAGNLGKAEDAAHSSGDTGVAILGVRRDTVVSSGGTDGDYSTLNLDANGRLYVTATVDAALPAGSNTIGAVTQASGPWSQNVTQLGGTSIAVNSGTASAGTLRVVIATDQTQLTNALKVDGSAVTQPVSVASAVTVAQATASSLKVEPAGNVASGATDSGNPIKVAGKYNSTPITLTDGQRGDMQLDAAGRLIVNVAAGGGTGGTSATDDGAFTVASGSGTPIMGVVTADSVDSGDVGVIGMLANRQMKVTLYNSGGTEVSVGGGTQYAEDAAASSGDTGNMVLAVRQDTIASSTSADGDYSNLKVTSAGRLYTSATIDAAIPAGANIIGALSANQSVNVAQINGVTATMGNGVSGTGVQRVTIASDSTGVVGLASGSNTVGAITSITTSIVPGTAATNLGKAEDAAAASGDTGVMALAVRQDTISSSTSADGDYGSIKINSVGRLYTSASIDAAIPAGTNTIGGITSITTSIIPGTAATNLGKAIDSAVGSTDTGIAALAQRNDTPATLTPADGDYTTLKVNSTGALYCYVTNGITSIAEDTASSGGEDGLPILAVRRDSATSGVSADGDWANLSVDSSGALRVVGSSGTTQYTEDGVSAGGESLCLMGAVRRDTAASSSGADGDYSTVNTDSAGRVWVNASGAAVPVTDNSGSLTVDNGGTFAVQAAQSGTWNVGTVTTVTTVSAVTDASVQGKAAHDAAVSGNPILNGAYASAAAPTAVSTDGDVVRLWADLNGRLQVGDGGSTLSIDDGAGSLTVDGTVAVSSITTAVVPGTAATNLGKAEDAAAGDGDTGVAVLAVRRDSASSGVSADGDYANLSVDSTGALRVTGGGGGTQYAEDAAAVSGDTGTLALVVRQDSITGSTSADGDYTTFKSDSVGRVYVNASGVAVPITDNSGSITVDNAGTFAVQATVAAAATNIAKAEDVASADADVGVPAMAVRKATPANTSGTDGDYEMLQMSAGRLWVDPSGVTLTVASHAVTNAGTFAVQVDGNALTSLQLIDDTIIADDAAFTVGTTKVNVIGHLADETATDSVDEGDVGASRMTLDRKLIVTPYAHAAAGGNTPYQNLDCDETEDDIKTSAGKLYWVHAINLTASKRYLKFYNATAANTTVGSTTPVLTFPIPTMGDTNGAGFTINFGAMGVQFDTAICVAATTGFAVADTGAPGTNDVILNCGYL